MELYSFNQTQLQNNYNRLLDLYLTANTDNEKIKIYHELLVLREYLHKAEISNIQKPQNYYNIISREIVKKDNFYKSIDNLTEELCYYWCHSMKEIKTNYKGIFHQDKITKGEYYNDIKSFIGEVFPDDIKLFIDAFKEERIMLAKSLFTSEKMIYLDSLGEYYIVIKYFNKLNRINVRNTIHEFGHVSDYMASKVGSSKDYIMDEVVAELYELLYIGNFCKNSKDIISEFSRLLNLVKLTSLNDYYFQRAYNRKIFTYEMFLKSINFMYSSIISLALYVRRNDLTFNEILRYIKENRPYIPAFELLKEIGIDESELIWTSKNVKKLIIS